MMHTTTTTATTAACTRAAVVHCFLLLDVLPCFVLLQSSLYQFIDDTRTSFVPFLRRGRILPGVLCHGFVLLALSQSHVRFGFLYLKLNSSIAFEMHQSLKMKPSLNITSSSSFKEATFYGFVFLLFFFLFALQDGRLLYLDGCLF